MLLSKRKKFFDTNESLKERVIKIVYELVYENEVIFNYLIDCILYSY